MGLGAATLLETLRNYRPSGWMCGMDVRHKGDLGQPRLAILCGFQFIGARSSDTGRYNLQRWCSLRRFWCGG